MHGANQNAKNKSIDVQFLDFIFLAELYEYSFHVIFELFSMLHVILCECFQTT